jgi:hypothetical protein
MNKDILYVLGGLGLVLLVVAVTIYFRSGIF